MPRFLPVSNPRNRFETTSLEYDDGEHPHAELDVIEDRSKSILATNDSPDVGFRWSVNPYRGCVHSCAYCLDGDTRITLADGRTKLLRDLRVRDEIYGTTFEGGERRLVRTHVLAHWQTLKRAYRVVLADGTELVASADHRFLTDAGWRYVTNGGTKRPELTLGASFVGTGDLGVTPEAGYEYMRGYVCGTIRGEGMAFERLRRRRKAPAGSRLRLVDLEGLRRTRRYLADAEILRSDDFLFLQATAGGAPPIRAAHRQEASAVRRVIEWPVARSNEWARGFLAGIFDSEGSFDRGVLRLVCGEGRIFDEVTGSLALFGFDVTIEASTSTSPASVVVGRTLREQLRFFQLVDPANRRKIDLEGTSIGPSAGLQVESVTDLGFDMPMFDITTGTGDFIANGIVSHNCYARPTHEYLSLGAGTDFERKIVVKPRAPELLRESFDKPSWKGELVVFSGITDCYQPLESKLRLTRGCLEVCAEYKNPVGIITKSPVVERDIDVLQQLARDASVRVSVSVPFWDRDAAKAMEPMVTTPERRMKIIETLAKAGVPVGVSVSPIVPGLNDDHLGDVLERARDAGARHAFYVLLRLPGAVKQVFEKALREKLPLRAEKVLRRLREAHDGKLYDASFGSRGRGGGVYAGTLRMLFERSAKRCGLNADEMNHYVSPSTFRRPAKHGQTTFGF